MYDQINLCIWRQKTGLPQLERIQYYLQNIVYNIDINLNKVSFPLRPSIRPHMIIHGFNIIKFLHGTALLDVIPTTV